MNVSAAILGYLNFIKDQTLSHFDILDVFVFDESLDFRGRASQYIAREGVFQKEEGTPPKDWIFIIWNRGSLSTNDTSHNRVLNVTLPEISGGEYIDSISTMRMATLSLELKIVTNNIELAEEIEEWLHVLSGELVSFEADYGEPFGIINCSSQAETSTTFEKEDINEVGSTMAIGLQADISFPIILAPKKAKIIKHIHSKIYSSLDKGSLESDEWIKDPPP